MVIESIAACFMKENDQAYFGACPTQDQVNELEEWGVDIIINLTYDTEKKLSVYNTSRELINWPIPDRGAPSNKAEFCTLVLYLARMLGEGKKIYVHCKAGHGRSGIITAALIAVTQQIPIREAMELTTQYHSERTNMRPYWKRVGSPQTSSQKRFLYSVFKQHVIGPESPFLNITFKEPYLDSFLLQTYLGDIVGPNSKPLKKSREELFLAPDNLNKICKK